MKTERRHELHSNALATWLSQRIDTLRPYSRLVAGIVLAVVVLGAAYTYFSSQSAETRQQGWRTFFGALDKLRAFRDPQDMIALSQAPDHQKTDVGYWSQLTLGDFYYAAGVDDLFSDRAAATSALRLAVTNYTQVANQTQFPMLAERATLGLGRAYESLNELDNARQSYENLVTKWPDGAYTAEAKARLDDLKRDSTKRFYDWFFAQAPARQSLGGPGAPGNRPDFGSVPDEGMFAAPKADSDRLLNTPPAKADSDKNGDGEPGSLLERGAAPSAEPPSESAADAPKP